MPERQNRVNKYGIVTQKFVDKYSCHPVVIYLNYLKICRWHAIMVYLPCILFVAFGITLFGLFSMPMAVVPGQAFGEGASNISLGSFYNLFMDMGSSPQVYESEKIAFVCVFFAPFVIMIGAVLCGTAHLKFIRSRKSFSGVKHLTLLTAIAEVWEWCIYVLYMALSASVMANCEILYGGLVIPGSGTICIFIISSALLLVQTVSKTVERKLYKHVMI